MKIQIRNTQFEVADATQLEQTWKYINTGQWEKETFDILDNFVADAGVVLDIGCWAGPISLYIANRASLVYAVDPDSVAFAHIQTNVALNPSLATKIKTFRVAISEQSALLPLYARDDYGQSSSSLLPRIRDTRSEEQVEALSFDDFLSKNDIQRIDFIKMDIEGGEFVLLPSMTEALQRLGKPTLYVSFHYGYLQENEYFKNIPYPLLAKALMKMERWCKLDFFQKNICTKVIHSIQQLDFYKNIYTEQGVLIDFKTLLKNPTLVKKHNLVFTNQDWEIMSK